MNLGAYVTGRSGWPVGNIGGTAGVYHIPAIYAESCGILTNTVPTAAYRGAGRPEATYTIERIIDIAARELGISPYELRRRNLIPPEAMPYKTALTFTYDCGEFEGNMEKAAEIAELDSFAARRADAESRGKLRGIGLCNCIEVAGGPFLRPAKDQASLRLAEDGTLVLRSGSMSVGQGLETAFCQLVSDRFGIPMDQVLYEAGDTDMLSGGKGNGGSGALCIGGGAVDLVVDKVIDKARQVAAELLEAAEIDVTFDAGRFTIAGTDRSVSLAEVARAATIDGNELVESGEFAATAVTFPNGTHICEVEIDPDTGVTEVVRYSAVEELGHVLNPMLVAGQTHGGVAQGVGQAMGEQIVHDPHSGQMLTASFMDYQMPRADDLPDIHMATREVPTKVNPLGAKGVGEAGTVGAMAAAMNAVNDALAPLGIRHFDMPAITLSCLGGHRRGAHMTEPLFHMIAGAPTPVAPFSHAVEADGWVFLTGQMPTLPDDDSAPLPDGIEAQTRRVMDNLIIVLRGLGLGLQHVVSVRAYLTRFEQDYAPMNAVYRSYFPPDRLPARTCVGVTGLARGALVEIDLVARR